METLWQLIRREAEAAREKAPDLARLFDAVLAQASLADAISARIAARLGDDALPSDAIFQRFRNAIGQDAAIADGMAADLQGVFGRDPACKRAIEPLLYFKGFQALQTHRLAHHLWQQDQTDLALYLQSRASAVFGADIHPAVRIGKNVVLDHATGFVAGATCVIEDDVNLLQNVTLGGRGRQIDRHPKIRRGASIGAGALVLGNVEIGPYARVGAGAVVLWNVPAKTTAVGVPARIVQPETISMC